MPPSFPSYKSHIPGAGACAGAAVWWAGQSMALADSFGKGISPQPDGFLALAHSSHHRFWYKGGSGGMWQKSMAPSRLCFCFRKHWQSVLYV